MAELSGGGGLDLTKKTKVNLVAIIFFKGAIEKSNASLTIHTSLFQCYQGIWAVVKHFLDMTALFQPR